MLSISVFASSVCRMEWECPASAVGGLIVVKRSKAPWASDHTLNLRLSKLVVPRVVRFCSTVSALLATVSPALRFMVVGMLVQLIWDSVGVVD